MRAQEKLFWRSPVEIVEIAFQRAPVIMMNEAHSGLKRCIRTRQIGTVPFDHSEVWSSLLEEYTHELHLYGGTAGFLAEEAPDVFSSDSSEDAFLLSTENELE